MKYKKKKCPHCLSGVMVAQTKKDRPFHIYYFCLNCKKTINKKPELVTGAAS